MAQTQTKDWRSRLHEIIYENNTFAGKAFDVTLLVLIVASIAVVMLDSMPRLHARFGQTFFALEWVFTILFTIEYILRLICIRRPLKYVTSKLGIIDLLAIVPSYVSLLLPGTQSLLALRALRLLRVFRIFKLTHFLSEAEFLQAAVRSSAKKIGVFMFAVLTAVIVLGSVMYYVEGGQNGYTSIPDSIYWAIVTITTVGYGDISPTTPLGKFIASLIMFLGYGILAVPTGIVTNEMVQAVRNKKEKGETCPGCGLEGHDADAVFCKRCGAKL